MPSPFPGMDPFLGIAERWPDFHHDFIVRCREQLNDRLPPNYIATIGERIELIDEQERRRRTKAIGPDVTIVHEPVTRPRSRRKSGAGIATLEPLVLPNDIESFDLPLQLFVEITHLPDQKVVTDIELLSPSNKRKGSKDRIAYLAKRKNHFLHEVNVVEIDLLLGGERLPMLVELPEGDYFAFSTHGPNWYESDVYSWSIRDALPTLPVPLKPEDGTVLLDLALAFNQTYNGARYERILKYEEFPPGLLADGDRAWVGELLRGE